MCVLLCLFALSVGCETPTASGQGVYGVLNGGRGSPHPASRELFDWLTARQ